jgi:hypothetical protein
VERRKVVTGELDHYDEKAQLRVIAHRVLEESDGNFSPLSLLEDVDPELSDVSLEELATDEIRIIHGMWGQSRTSGEDSYVAYSLGFGDWYVVHTDAADEVTSDSIVTDANCDEAFRDIAKRWINDFCPAFASLPTEFFSIHANEPWFIREFAAAMGRTVADPVYTIADDIVGGREISSEDRDAIHSYWWTAVQRVDTAEEVAVPGLTTVSTEADVPEFDAWIESVSLRWKDTGHLLEPDDARSLRLTCQFLGLT